MGEKFAFFSPSESIKHKIVVKVMLCARIAKTTCGSYEHICVDPSFIEFSLSDTQNDK